MREGINAPRHAADDDQSAPGQVGCEPLCHPDAIRRRMARAHYCDSRLGEQGGITANVKRHRRIVDLPQQRRETTIIQRDDLRPGGCGPNQLLLRHFQRFADGDRLRRVRLKAGSLQLS